MRSVPFRVMSIVAVFLGVCSAGIDAAYAAPPESGVAAILQVTPAVLKPGQQPEVSANVKVMPSSERTGPLEVNVVAIVTRPDYVTKTWQWKNLKIAPGEVKALSYPKAYETRLVGTYKVELLVYSSDMRRRLASVSQKFDVAVPSPVPSAAQPEPASARVPGSKPLPSGERWYAEIGAYGNALNPAGGGTLLLWPFARVGLQGIYSVGKFTSYEGRLLVRFNSLAGMTPYAGAGFLSVSKKADVLGVETTFKDSGASGVVGVEIPLGRRVRGILELSGAAVDLKRTVVSGTQTARAEVEYSPVTLGAGLVISLF